ncbi:G domain-containing protein [Mycena sanguinolenta]|uniref:G domain-containing protein n=1 Tax=Mycena sanguinolenta TaxID=230812 RepID=A0A8H6X3T2_9AGAR|nr:G domain-containing protein [Mycena sanguinolenta]
MDFEPGNTEEFERAKEFFKSRGQKVPLKGRVHAIWLCIKVPHAGSRVFETGDEEFLNLAAGAKDIAVPVVVVFTQFDVLYGRMEMMLTDEETRLPPDQVERLCSQRAEDEFKKICLPPMRTMDPMPRHARTSGLGPKGRPDGRALADLITTTLDLLGAGETSGFIGKILTNTQNRETVWITSAIAQRGSAQANISGSIKIGMKKYWRGIASSTRFPGFKLQNCLNTLHIDIVTSWNFNNPNKLLRCDEFLQKMQTVTQLVVPREDETKDWLCVAFTETSSPLRAPPVPSIQLPSPSLQVSDFPGCSSNGWPQFIKRTSSPETLRLFMGYIVDLTLVLDQLFVIVLALRPPNLLTQTEIDAAVDKYTSGAVNTVHTEIREYCNEATFGKICRSNKAEEKITELIEKHRVKGKES